MYQWHTGPPFVTDITANLGSCKFAIAWKLLFLFILTVISWFCFWVTTLFFSKVKNIAVHISVIGKSVDFYFHTAVNLLDIKQQRVRIFDVTWHAWTMFFERGDKQSVYLAGDWCWFVVRENHCCLICFERKVLLAVWLAGFTKPWTGCFLNRRNRTGILVKPVGLPIFSGSIKEWYTGRFRYRSSPVTPKIAIPARMDRYGKLCWLVADKASEQCIGGERRVHTVGSDSVSFKETCAALTNFLHNHFLIISIITHSQQKKKTQPPH